MVVKIGRVPDHYCVTCGRSCGPGAAYGCCNESTDSSGGPVAARPAPDWGELSERMCRLIELLLDVFGGVAREWDVLCRLPWTPADLHALCGAMPERDGDWSPAWREPYPGAADGFLVLRHESPDGKEARIVATERARAILRTARLGLG